MTYMKDEEYLHVILGEVRSLKTLFEQGFSRIEDHVGDKTSPEGEDLRLSMGSMDVKLDRLDAVIHDLQQHLSDFQNQVLRYRETINTMRNLGKPKKPKSSN